LTVPRALTEPRGQLCRLHLAAHGLSGDIQEANTYYDDPHTLVSQFDRVMALNDS